MRYLSMINLLERYNELTKEYRSLLSLNYNNSQLPLQQGASYAPFAIRTMADKDGSMIKMLTHGPGMNPDRMYTMRNMPATMQFAPILEIEWMRTLPEMPGEMVDALEQIAYFTFLNVISWRDYNEVESTELTGFDNIMERSNFFIDTEINEETATDIYQRMIGLESRRPPKVRSWSTVYMYGSDFRELFGCCEQQSCAQKEYYLHLPMLMFMFLAEYKRTNLKYWDNGFKLRMETTMQQIIQAYNNGNDANYPVYTYGLSSGRTIRDTELLTTMFGIIKAALHECNSNIGTINIYDYNKVHGPETIRATIMLSGMNVNWQDEIIRVAHEKQVLAEHEAAGLTDGTVDEGN